MAQIRQQLDPIFSMQPAPAGYFGSTADLLEQIGSLEDDIASDERDIRDIDRDIPKMEIERLTKQRDVAIAKLKIIELRAKLQAKTGGAA